MIRFAHGRAASIGFHDIPRYRGGALVHPVSGLGQALGKGGCPHLTTADAQWLYRWAGIGTKVVVVESGGLSSGGPGRFHRCTRNGEHQSCRGHCRNSRNNF